MIFLSKHFTSAQLKDLLGAAALAALQAELPQVTEQVIDRTRLLAMPDGGMAVEFALRPEVMASAAATSKSSKRLEAARKAAGQ